MTNYDVVIIDSGVASNVGVLGVSIEYAHNGGCVVNDVIEDVVGHGTIIYSIISRVVDKQKIFVIKLPGFQEGCDESCLIYALEYVEQYVDCKLINVSLGLKTSSNIEKLYSICSNLKQRGTIIVAAFDNDGCYSYPAAFDCVIGVDKYVGVRQKEDYVFVENSPVNILAKGQMQRVVMPNGDKVLVAGSSIACAHVTSIIANNMLEIKNFDGALQYLKANAKQINSSHRIVQYSKRRFFKINNAVTFPFSKEMQALARFEDELSFRIHNYYDIRYSGKVGRLISSFIEGSLCEKRIMDVNLIDFSNVDTLILGHLDELNSFGHDYRQELIFKAVQAGVNIFSFDPLDEYVNMLETANINYYFPRVTKEDVPHNTFGKLYKIGKPVLGIYGTSSQQGKFSLQLALKKELMLCGYDVGAVGTEPHSLLFGFDVDFPIGYNSTVYLSNSDIVLYLNHEINKLCFDNKDIILTASQAQIVPFCGNNMLEFPNKQLFFALGTMPDAVVVCVNVYDELDYIRNTMYTIMGLTSASVISLVVFPMTYTNEWTGVFGSSKRKISFVEFESFAETLNNEFHVPVFLLGNPQHMKELCKIIVDFF